LILIRSPEKNNNNNFCDGKGSIILNAPSRKGSSYIRTTKKDTNEINEKRALGEIYNFIKIKFNNPNLEKYQEGNFQLNLPFHVKKNKI